MKILKFFLFSFFLFFFLGSLVSAGTVGMGVKWYTESEIVNENMQRCISYGLYNPEPFDMPVMGFFEATDGLADIYVKQEPTLIPVHTSSINAIPKDVCFNIPKVYEENCILGLFCERICPEQVPGEPWKNEVRFSGNIIGKYILLENLSSSGVGTGSKTGSSIAVPLALAVQCIPEERNQVAFYATIAVVVIVLIAIILWLTKKSKKKRN